MDSNGEIEEKLDAVVLEFFSTLDDLYKEQTCLNEDMKNGFLQMSRARYNMGAKAISQSQYDENKMAASIKVDVEDGSKGGNLVLISNMTSVVNENPAEDASVETIGLRKRNVPKSEQNTSTEEKETDHQEKKGSAETPVSVNKKQFPDPLNWFGVLVPQSLRHSQASFKHAIEQTVKIANLKLKLEELRKNYIDCMGMKVKEKLNLVADK